MIGFLYEVRSSLNKQQFEAVENFWATVLVLSGAGTGKTKTISYKVAYAVLQQKVDINRILALTFTNKAASEMKERIFSLLEKYQYDFGKFSKRSIYIGTFHSICIKILRWHASVLGYTSSFTIINDDDQTAIIKRLIKKHDFNVLSKPKQIKNILSKYKNDFLMPQDVLNIALEKSDPFLQQISQLYQLYQDDLKQSNAMDFDDIQLNVIHLCYQDKDIHRFWQNQFQVIMVDEFQDTNKVQYILLKLFINNSIKQSITFVGDDDQSIYSFRGANIGNILNLEQDLENVSVIRLEENYRSTPQILSIANNSIRNNINRLGKTLFTNNNSGINPVLYVTPTEEDEAQFCIEQIKNIDLSKNSVAIIYRINIQSKVIERELVRAGISYQLYGGRKFFEKKEILDMVAYLRVIENSYDYIAFARIINIPSRGIGKTSEQYILTYIKENNIDIFDIPNIISHIKISKRAKEDLLQLIAILRDLRLNKNSEKIVSLLLEHINYIGYLLEYDDDEKKTIERENSIEELQKAFAKVLQEEGTLGDFLEDIALIDSSTTNEVSKAFLVLTTVHGCKGLEFDYVFIVGLVEEIFPYHFKIQTTEQLEEERRLFYVAVTRARKMVYFSLPLQVFLHGQVYMGISQFITEIRDEIEELSSKYLISSDEGKWYKKYL